MNFDCNGFIWYQIWPLVKDSLYSRTIVYVPVVSIHAYTLPIALWPCRPEGYCSCLHPSICLSILLYEFVCTIDQERFFKCFWNLAGILFIFSTLLALCQGNHQWLVGSPYRSSLMQKCFHVMTSQENSMSNTVGATALSKSVMSHTNKTLENDVWWKLHQNFN